MAAKTIRTPVLNIAYEELGPAQPKIGVPTIALFGVDDGVTALPLPHPGAITRSFHWPL